MILEQLWFEGVDRDHPSSGDSGDEPDDVGDVGDVGGPADVGRDELPTCPGHLLLQPDPVRSGPA